MKLNCLCTAHGLVPLYDDDYEEKKRLKRLEAVAEAERQVLEAEIEEPLNNNQ